MLVILLFDFVLTFPIVVASVWLLCDRTFVLFNASEDLTHTRMPTMIRAS